MSVWLGIGLFLILAIGFGLLLGYAAVRFKVEGDPLVEIIDQKLPQTQCGQCGYPGCKPYAEALAKGEAEVNLCIPGGEPTMLDIAEILKVDPKPMSAEATEPKPPMVALIDEDLCIGCVLCIKACPVDAILGATKMMHTVIAKECTGCELCIPVCPVDCISMISEDLTSKNWKWPQPNAVTRIPIEIKAIDS